MKLHTGRYVAAALVAAAATGTAQAAPPAPEFVANKVFSTYLDDRAANGSLAPTQTLLWGSPDNGYRYSTGAPWFASEQVDALGGEREADVRNLVAGRSLLLFNVGNQADLYWESPGTGGAGWWGRPPKPATVHAIGTDALTVGGSTSGYVSFHGDGLMDDFVRGDMARVSVWWSGGRGIVYADEIARAIGRPELESQVDLDALLMAGPDSLVFSIAPLYVDGKMVFDGGEIWTWNRTASPAAAFLNHGGHLWDTSFEVAKTFGLHSEDVTVLATAPVPEPETYAMFLTGLGLLGLARRRAARRP